MSTCFDFKVTPMDVTAHCLSYVMRVEGAHIIAATSKHMDQCVYRKESWEGVYKNAMIDFGTVRLRDWAMSLLGEITSQASLIRVCPHNAFILPHMSASVELQWTWRRVPVLQRRSSHLSKQLPRAAEDRNSFHHSRFYA